VVIFILVCGRLRSFAVISILVCGRLRSFVVVCGLQADRNVQLIFRLSNHILNKVVNVYTKVYT